MAEWLASRNSNPEVKGSSPALTAKLELFLGRPQFNSSSASCQLGFLTMLCSFTLLVS